MPRDGMANSMLRIGGKTVYNIHIRMGLWQNILGYPSAFLQNVKTVGETYPSSNQLGKITVVRLE